MTLPPEILIIIFRKLNQKDLEAAAKVNKSWNAAANDQSLLKNRFVKIRIKKDVLVFSYFDSSGLDILDLEKCSCNSNHAVLKPGCFRGNMLKNCFVSKGD